MNAPIATETQSAGSLHRMVMQPFYDVDGITIFCGDNRRILPLLDDYDLLLTDPPYGIGVVNNTHGSVTSINSGSKSYGRSDWDNATPPEWALQLAVAKAKWQIIWGGKLFRASAISRMARLG